MPNPRYVVVTPEERELKQKAAELATLEGELAERELELATLQKELRAFERTYLCTVGPLYAELDDLEARLAEINARQHPTDPSYVERATHARSKAAESARALTTVDDVQANTAPGEELKGLYREIARQVHPDLAPDDASRPRRTRLMAEANAAYAIGDVAKLRAILDEWHSSPELVEGVGVAAELVRAIRKIHQIHRRLTELDAALSALRQSPFHSIAKDVAIAREQGRDLLAEMATDLKRQIDAARARRVTSAAGEVASHGQ